jgi:hypothetical protein
MILQLLKGRGMVSGLFEKKRDDILSHPASPIALTIMKLIVLTYLHITYNMTNFCMKVIKTFLNT